jgi:regulator of replication initiation timing
MFSPFNSSADGPSTESATPAHPADKTMSAGIADTQVVTPTNSDSVQSTFLPLLEFNTLILNQFTSVVYEKIDLINEKNALVSENAALVAKITSLVSENADLVDKITSLVSENAALVSENAAIKDASDTEKHQNLMNRVKYMQANADKHAAEENEKALKMKLELMEKKMELMEKKMASLVETSAYPSNSQEKPPEKASRGKRVRFEDPPLEETANRPSEVVQFLLSLSTFTPNSTKASSSKEALGKKPSDQEKYSLEGDHE